MKSQGLLISTLLIICASCFLQATYYYPLLPERVPSHFGASGMPDAWSSKNSFVIFYLLVVAGCSVLFLGLSFGLSRLPASLINLPHKEFWLAPERKEKTFTYLTRYFLRFASATLVLLLYIFHQSFQVAVGNAMMLSHLITALVVYLALLLVWTVRMILKFKNPYDD